MNDGANRNQFAHRVDVLIFLAEFADERQLGIDQFLAEMPQVEMNHRSVGRRRGAAFAFLVNKRLRQTVTRSQLHAAQNRLWLRLSKVVVLQVAVAVLVQHVAALGAGGFGDQDAGERQTRRMVLHELHVFERSAGAKGQRHAITALDVGVCREGKDAAATAGAENHCLRQDRLNSSRHQLDGDDAADHAVVDEQLGDEPLVVARDRLILHSCLEERVQHVEAGFVGGKPGAHFLHATEGANRDMSVGLAIPRASPALQLRQLLRSFRHEGFDRILIAEPVAARDGVVGVFVETVVGLGHSRCAAFRGHGVTAHWVDLGDDGDVELGIDFGRGNRSP